jgi:hypothetical protein
MTGFLTTLQIGAAPSARLNDEHRIRALYLLSLLP